MRKRTGLPACWLGSLYFGLSLLAPRPACATPIVLDVTVTTCFTCWSYPDPDPTFPDINMTAQLTVEQTAGSFWDPWYQTYSSSGLMVQDVSGTFTYNGDSYPLASVPVTQGDGSWLMPGGSVPRYFVFSAEGFGYGTRLINDNAYNLFQWTDSSGYGGQVPVQWSAVPAIEAAAVPDASSPFMLLSIGFVAVIFLTHRLSPIRRSDA